MVRAQGSANVCLQSFAVSLGTLFAHTFYFVPRSRSYFCAMVSDSLRTNYATLKLCQGTIRSAAGSNSPCHCHVCLFLLHHMGFNHSEFFLSILDDNVMHLAYQPLFPADSSIHAYFPARVWAIRLPALVLILGLGVVGTFIGVVMQKEAAKKREKEARRAA